MSWIAVGVRVGLSCLLVVVTLSHGWAAESTVPLVFSEGHDIGPDDHGRPVVLIAAALGVKPEAFRRAFDGVTPSRNGSPSGAEARRNKQALMKVLGPLSVTNERLDEVSNYYRFRPQDGELWNTTPAKGYAVVEGGKVKKVVVTEDGSGYSSPPLVTVEGMNNVRMEATLHFDRDFKKNGSVKAVEVSDGAKRRPDRTKSRSPRPSR